MGTKVVIAMSAVLLLSLLIMIWEGYLETRNEFLFSDWNENVDHTSEVEKDLEEGRKKVLGLEKDLEKRLNKTLGLAKDLEEGRSKILGLEKDLEKRLNKTLGQAKDLEEGRSKILGLEKDLEEGRSKILGLEKDLEKRLSKTLGLAKDLEEGRSKILGLEKDLEEGQSKILGLEKDLEEGRSKIIGLESKLQKAEHALDLSRAQLENASARNVSKSNQQEQPEFDQIDVTKRYPYGKCFLRGTGKLFSESGSAPSCFRPFRWVRRPNWESLYTENELKSLKERKCWNRFESCCIGSISFGGKDKFHAGACLAESKVPWGMQETPFETKYDWVLETQFRSSLFTFHDALDLVEENTTIGIIGDSVMRQTFEGLMCSLARSGASITRFVYYPRKRKIFRYGSGDRQEVTVVTESGKQVFLVFHTEYRFTKDGLSQREICMGSDILIFNYGLHWNSRSELQTMAKDLVDIFEHECKGVKKIFRGTTTQHFPTPGGQYKKKSEYPTYAKLMFPENSTSMGSPEGCVPVRFKNPDEEYDFRNYAVVEGFLSAGYRVEITPWHKKSVEAVDGDRTLFYIPFGEVSMARFDNHAGECTHFCSSPLTWAPVEDGIYLAFRQLFSPGPIGEPKARTTKDYSLGKPKKINDPHFLINYTNGVY